MTIRVRNTIFIAGLGATGLLLLLYIAGTVLLLHYLAPGIFPADLVNSRQPYFHIIPIFLLLCYILLSGILLHKYFRKTSSAEIFFFFIFLLLSSVEVLRILILTVDLKGLPFETSITLSRIVYFGRYMGTLCLFTSGLFACGMQYQRMEAVLGICVLIALSLSTTIPLDTGSEKNALLFSNGLVMEFFVGFLVIQILGMGNYFYAGMVNDNRNYYVMALGIGLVFAGRELLFRQMEFQLPLLSLFIGFLLLALGTFIFGKRTHEIYLWF